jgi:hypothetical protein
MKFLDRLIKDRGRPKSDVIFNKVPRKRKRLDKSNSFLSRHIWYCGWGLIGLAGINAIYEKSPNLAKRISSIYISLWLFGAIYIPYMIRNTPENGAEAKQLNESEAVKLCIEEE